MFQHGLLLLTSSPRILIPHIDSYLKTAHQLVQKTLYVKLEPLQGSLSVGRQELASVDWVSLSHFVPYVYSRAAACCTHLDIRVLQGFTKRHNLEDCHIKCSFDVVITDTNCKQTEICQYLQQQFQKSCENFHYLKDVLQQPSSHGWEMNGLCDRYKSAVSTYRKVVLGGTFDRLHNGHKVLLSEAVLLCKEHLIVGITDGAMITKKTLWELIEPAEVRMASMVDFLYEVDPTVKYDVVPIYDVFGPSIVLTDIECIVVSEETKKGGLRVNEERENRKLKPLDLHVIGLLDDPQHNCYEETKISSSSVRMRLLGTLIRPPPARPDLPLNPYIIGLTGGIASGKTSITRHLETLGATIIYCDPLAHKTYEPGNSAYQPLVSHFGTEILNPDGTIIRKALGAKVFGNEAERQRLNAIVWPELEKLVHDEIARHTNNGSKVIVIEAAILIEAKWEDKVHQVWVSIIPETVAMQRVMARDNLTEEQARLRIQSQLSNSERVASANVVFCSQWELEYTLLQVNNAWKELQNFLSTDLVKPTL